MSADRNQQSVLAVDDQALVLDLIESALVEGGYAVRTALSGVDALACVEGNRARDLLGLVTDVNLGKAPNGWAVARRARELNPAMFVIYVSGDSAHEMVSQGVPRGVMLQKPFTPAELIRTVSSLDVEPAAED